MALLSVCFETIKIFLPLSTVPLYHFFNAGYIITYDPASSFVVSMNTGFHWLSQIYPCALLITSNVNLTQSMQKYVNNNVLKLNLGFIAKCRCIFQSCLLLNSLVHISTFQESSPFLFDITVFNVLPPAERINEKPMGVRWMVLFAKGLSFIWHGSDVIQVNQRQKKTSVRRTLCYNREIVLKTLKGEKFNHLRRTTWAKTGSRVTTLGISRRKAGRVKDA